MNYMMQEREQDSRIPAQSEPAKKKQTSLLWGAVVCSVAALCVSIGALRVALPKAEPEPASEPEAAVDADLKLMWTAVQPDWTTRQDDAACAEWVGKLKTCLVQEEAQNLLESAGLCKAAK